MWLAEFGMGRIVKVDQQGYPENHSLLRVLQNCTRSAKMDGWSTMRLSGRRSFFEYCVHNLFPLLGAPCCLTIHVHRSWNFKWITVYHSSESQVKVYRADFLIPHCVCSDCSK